MTTVAEPINLFDFELIAKGRMEPAEYDYVAGGAMDEITLGRTRAAFDAIGLRPRRLTGHGSADLSTTVLDQRLPVPFMLAPCGGHDRAHPEGELATARAAARFGTVLGIPVNGSHTLEAVAREADGPHWFQAYFYEDREITKLMARRAEQAGCTALCITVDAGAPAKRERNIRNRYQQPPRPNYEGVKTEASGRPRFDAQAGWDSVSWLKSVTRLPVVIKGIMTAEDALECVRAGADALIVSNHGARYVDSTAATIEVLPEVVDAVGGRAEVYLDGGIRRGADIAKAIALGARAVLFGRPFFWGLAYAGEEGVHQVLSILRDELESTMLNTGRPTIDSIDSTLICRLPPLG